jgi:hypothetical protein
MDAPSLPRARTRLLACLAGAALTVTACNGDDPSGTHEDPTDPAFTGDGPVQEGTAPPPLEEPTLPDDSPTPGEGASPGD